MNYSVKAAAHATGVTESALRTWERRYGVPNPGRSRTGRRLYEERDLDVIRRMAALVGAGVPASEAASAVLTESDALATKEESAPPPNPAVRPLVAAALALDEPRVVDLLRQAVTGHGWPDAIDQVFFGCLREIGGLWRDNRVPAATEHFFTELARREISRAIAETDPILKGPTVVLACPQDERHDVGLLALSLLLRLRRVRVCYLGADVPVDDLIEVLLKGAVAVCIGATLGSSRASAARATRQIVEGKINVTIFVGGPAFLYQEHSEYVAGIMLPVSITAAAEVIAARVGKEPA